MYAPKRADEPDEDEADRHITENILANGGRFYEDETWATSETPAPFVNQPQTGYENSSAANNGARERNFRDEDIVGASQDDDEGDDDYTYANEGDEGSAMDYTAAFQSAAAPASSMSRNSSRSQRSSNA